MDRRTGKASILAGYHVADPDQALTLICDYDKSKFYIVSIGTNELAHLNVPADIDWAMLVAYHRGRMENITGLKRLPKKTVQEVFPLLISSAAFVRAFMTSGTAKDLDSRYNRMQWAGEEYLLEEVADAAGDALTADGDIFAKDVLYWIGYIYRYWHYYDGEDSAKIYKQAPVETMKRNYMMFHTMDPILAIEDLKEIHSQKQ